MPGPPSYVYWDSDLFLAYLNAEPKRLPTLDAIVQDIRDSDGSKRIVTSVISKVEVAFIAYERRGLDPVAEERIDALWQDSAVVELVELNDEIARQARTLLRESLARGWSRNPRDVIHLASAQYANVNECHTYDEGWDKYAQLIGVKICRPYVAQARLPNL